MEPNAKVFYKLIIAVLADAELLIKATEILWAWRLVSYIFDLILWFTMYKISWTDNSLLRRL